MCSSGLGEILLSVSNESGLDGSNVIYRIKEKLQSENEVVYQEWEEQQFNINLLFTVQRAYLGARNRRFALLHIATAIGATNLVKALLEVEGINVDKKTGEAHVFFPSGFTPLQIAAVEGYKGIAELLIEKGASVNKCSSFGKRNDTPLQLAVKNDRTDLVEFLAERTGVDFGVIDREGNNLLHYAANCYSEATIRILINKEVDPWLKNSHGETPIDIYMSNHQNGSGYLKKLKEANNRSNVAFSLIAILGAIVVISIFVTNMTAPDIIASTTVAPGVLYAVIGISMFVLALIAKCIIYKAFEPSAKMAKEMQSLDMTNIEGRVDSKERLANPKKLAEEKRFLVQEGELYLPEDILKMIRDFNETKSQELDDKQVNSNLEPSNILCSASTSPSKNSTQQTHST